MVKWKITKTTNNDLQENFEDTKGVIGMNPYSEEVQSVECFVLFSFLLVIVLTCPSSVYDFWYLCHVTCLLAPLSCDLLSGTFVMWLVIWYLCHVTCYLTPLSCDLLSGTFVMWLVFRHLCHVTCYLAPLSCDLSSGTFVMWLVIWYLCHVTCYLEPLSCNLIRTYALIQFRSETLQNQLISTKSYIWLVHYLLILISTHWPVIIVRCIDCHT